MSDSIEFPITSNDPHLPKTERLAFEAAAVSRSFQRAQGWYMTPVLNVKQFLDPVAAIKAALRVEHTAYPFVPADIDVRVEAHRSTHGLAFDLPDLSDLMTKYRTEERSGLVFVLIELHYDHQPHTNTIANDIDEIEQAITERFEDSAISGVQYAALLTAGS